MGLMCVVCVYVCVCELCVCVGLWIFVFCGWDIYVRKCLWKCVCVWAVLLCVRFLCILHVFYACVVWLCGVFMWVLFV